MEFSVSSAPAERQRGGCVVVGVHERRRLTPAARAIDRACSGLLLKLVRSSAVLGKAGDTLLAHRLPGVKAERVLVVGCGPAGEVSPRDFRKSLRAAARAVVASGARGATSYLSQVEVAERDLYWKVRQEVEAAADAVYRFDRCKGEGNASPPPALRQFGVAVPERAERAAAERAVRDGDAISAGVRLAKDLGNLPANICTPSYLAEQARRLAAKHRRLSVRVRGEPEMRRLGMRTLLSVARGSREPPRFISLEYRGAAASRRPTVLIGKGVTFDSGGISIKPAAAMDEMKFDMCGAASVLGTLAAVADLGLRHNVVVLVPATENLPDGDASKPGDIITSMSGQTVEVLNTDAEGRLILCDALTFAARYKPEAVIDVATLTGACVIALGAHASGLFANDDPLAQSLLAAGEFSGDRAWRLPLWPEYGEALESNFADVANVGGREAGAVTAASFLARFAGDYRWAHLDIAGTAWLGGKEKGATGRPVRLLTQYLLERAAARGERAAA